MRAGKADAVSTIPFVACPSIPAIDLHSELGRGTDESREILIGVKSPGGRKHDGNA